MDDVRALIEPGPASTLAGSIPRGSPNQSRRRRAAASRAAPAARWAVVRTWLAVACASVVLTASAPAAHAVPREVSFETQPEAAEEVVVRELYEAFIKKEVSVSLTIPGTHKDFFGPQDHPYDAQLTLTKKSRGKIPIRIVMKPGTIIKGPGNDVVLLDEITLDLPPDHLAEKTIPVKAYRMRLPASDYGMDSLYRRPAKRAQYHLYNIHVRTASDPVRQAAVWIRNDAGMNYGRYAEFYSTAVTGPSGGKMTRTDPFQITKDQWAEAQRIARVVTPQQKRDMLLEKAKAKRKYEENLRLRAEAKAKAKEDAKTKPKTEAEQAKLIKADRKERTKVLTLLEALDDGLVSASMDALIAPPSKAMLTIEPTPALGATILDLIVPAGTVVREASGGAAAKTAYLSPARIEVELPDASSIRVHTHLRTLDDAGSGTFVFGRPYPLAAVLLNPGPWRPDRPNVHRDDPLARRPSRDSRYGRGLGYGGGELTQMTILIHGDKGKTWQEWKREFASRGMDDPYLALATAFKEAGHDLSPAVIHRSIRVSAIIFENEAQRVTAPDGSTYPEAHIIGDWKAADGPTAIDFFAGKEATAREIGAIERRHDLKLGMSPYVVSFNPDHSFEIVFSDTMGLRIVPGAPVMLAERKEVRFEHWARGSWIWDGLNVTLNIAESQWHGSWDRFKPLELYKGLLIVKHRPQIGSKNVGGPIVLTSGPARRPKPSAGRKERLATTDATPDTKPGSDKPKTRKLEPTHILLLPGGKYYYGRLISETDEAIRFKAVRGGIVADLTFKRSEITSVKKLESPPAKKPPDY